MPTLGRAEVTIHIGDFAARLDVIVADVQNDGILGHNFLHEHACQLDFALNKLELGDAVVPFEAYDELTITPARHLAGPVPQSAVSCEAVAGAKTNLVDERHVEEVRAARGNQTLPDALLRLYMSNKELLNDAEQNRLDELLRRNQVAFSLSDDDLGRTTLVRHGIDIGSAQPIRQGSRTIPMARRDEVRTEIQRMVERGVIERASSPWASALVLVPKKDGNTRFCVNYRRFNAVTRKD